MSAGREAEHEWLSFEDADEDRLWLLDLTFLSSPWRCIFANGCQGVLTEAAPELVHGCCSYGAHFSGEEDLARVAEAAAGLEPAQFQHRSAARRRGISARHGEDVQTRLVDGACIFLNRPGFPGGPGCALHRAALERGVPPMTLKPDVCWQLPLRREDSVDPRGYVTSTVTEWRRRHWGEAGADFHWWCTEAPEAFTAAEPLYRALRDEIVALTTPAVYAHLAEHLDRRRAEGTLLAHPTLRRPEKARR